MKTVTLRNLPPDLARVIQKEARAQRVSLNKAVIGLLKACVGRGPDRRVKIAHHDLDGLAGRWGAEEAAEFDQALAEQRVLEPSVWK
ncbi:MAG: hypothetical protein HYX74_09395 [Acidobacteria bacterium]|nr:hypothetical protein [Acidobacteriota bacterium]